MTARRARAAARQETPGEKEEPRFMPTLQKAKMAAHLADEQKAEHILILDVRGICNFTDFFIIASCTSSVQLRAVAHKIEGGLREEGERPITGGARDSSSWIVLDYGDVLVHLFNPETRNYYRLESLWADAKKVRWARRGGRAIGGQKAQDGGPH